MMTFRREMQPMFATYYDHNAHQILSKTSDPPRDLMPGDSQDKHKAKEMADESDNPPFPVGRASNIAIQEAWAKQQSDAAASWTSGMPFPLRVQGALASQQVPSLTVSSVIIPEGTTSSGVLVKANSAVWNGIANALGNDWSLALQFTPRQWEEIVAGAFEKAGYDQVILTPASGDYGRDVIAIKHGIGSVKVLGSVKAYAPDHLVPYDAVRALIGVITGERDTSKGIITTTSDFPPRIETDINIAPFLPTRLELVNGPRLQEWLRNLANP
jgi:restriction system protein